MNPLNIDIVKTLYFNLKYLPLNQALKFPIFIYRKVKFNKFNTSVKIYRAKS